MKLWWPLQLLGIVAISIGLWLIALSFSYQTVDLDIPLEIIGLDQNLAVDNPLTTVKIVAQIKLASAPRLNTANSIKAVLDLSHLNGLGQYQVEPIVSTTSPGVKIVNFAPDSFTIDLVPKISRTLPLEPALTGFLASGYSIKNVALSPDRVEVSGPESIVSTVNSAMVPITISDRHNSFVVLAQPELTDNLGGKLANVTFLPKQVTVSVTIAPGSNFKTVGLKPIFSHQLPVGYWLTAITFDPPAVTIKGNAEKLASIEGLATTPINLQDRYSDFNDKVSVELPTGVTLLEPNLISVKIKINTGANNREISLFPSYTNITEGFAVTLVAPSTVTVILSGEVDKLDKLSRANVSLDLDLRQYLSGVNQVAITKEMFRVSEGIEVVNFTPQILEVTLTKS